MFLELALKLGSIAHFLAYWYSKCNLEFIFPSMSIEPETFECMRKIINSCWTNVIYIFLMDDISYILFCLNIIQLNLSRTNLIYFCRMHFSGTYF